MKMTENEYKELMRYFEFFNDKVESCYRKETDALIKKLEEEYARYVVK